MFRSVNALRCGQRSPSTVYEFVVKDAKKAPYPLAQHRGHPLLIVNVASQCGLTSSGYATATTLHRKYKGSGLVVLGFPCNQFANQEPGTMEQIESFACEKHLVTFPILYKVDVNGKLAEPLFEFLKQRAPGAFGTLSVKWNFTFFVVHRDGATVKRLSPGAATPTVEQAVLEALKL
jgi:glutathione peroxidase-type tryparedoxin peroxidase